MPESGAPPTYRSGSQSVSAEGVESTPEERAAALAFLQKLAAEASAGTIDLPCFPDVVIRISTALADENSPIEHIVTVVGAEPRLAARLLQTANSAAFNPSGRPLTELRSAIARLGHQLVHGTAMAYAMQQLKSEASLKSIEQPLTALWNRSIAVASLCRIVAGRTRVNADEAFLTGLLHGIGSLYIMVRAATHSAQLGGEQALFDLLQGWQASIGRAVLESWKFTDELCEAVGEQEDIERRWKHEAGLADVLVVSVLLVDAMNSPEPRNVASDGVSAFMTVGVLPDNCPDIILEAEKQIKLVHEALSV